RADGYHDLRTVYQTITLHDVIRVSIGRGSGIRILCKDPRVPLDSSNTCYRMAERVLDELGAAGRVSIEIEKRLPVQGGLGAACKFILCRICLRWPLSSSRLKSVCRLLRRLRIGMRLCSVKELPSCARLDGRMRPSLRELERGRAPSPHNKTQSPHGTSN